MNPSCNVLLQIERSLAEKGFAAGRTIIYLPETDSTNDDAARMAAAGAAGGSIIIAASQRQGRGRLGKKWLSTPGTGLTFSYIARPKVSMKEVPRLTLVAGLAVANALEEQTELCTTIKWPNDILVGGRKVAGILCEFHGSGPMAGDPAVIIGIGINISSSSEEFPFALKQKATSLVLAGAANVSPTELLICIIRHLEAQLERLTVKGFASILTKWKEKDATKGKRLTWVDSGNRIVEGVSLGPDKEGVLHIALDTGRIVQVVSGDLSLASGNGDS